MSVIHVLYRKRILQAMQQMDSDNTINIVEELQIVEKQLRDFKDRLKALDQLEKSESTNDGNTKIQDIYFPISLRICSCAGYPVLREYFTKLACIEI